MGGIAWGGMGSPAASGPQIWCSQKTLHLLSKCEAEKPDPSDQEPSFLPHLRLELHLVGGSIWCRKGRPKNLAPGSWFRP